MQQRKVTFSTKIIDEINKKLDEGFLIPNIEMPYFDKIVGLRKSKLNFGLTKQEYESYIACAIDIFEFAKLCKLKDGNGRYTHFDIRDYQETMLKTFHEEKYTILLGSRQISKTTMSALFILHYALFNNEKNILIGANKGETAEEILEKVKEIYISLPFYIKKGIDVWNQRVIKFENKCRIKALTITPTSAIGNSADVVFLDEAAYIPDNVVSLFYKSVLPTMANIKNSKMIIASTPKGQNFFHKLWVGANLPKGHVDSNPFKPLMVKWHQVPGRNMIRIRPYPEKLVEYNITAEELYNVIKAKYNPNDERDKNKVPFTNFDINFNNGNVTIEVLIREDVVNKEDILEMQIFDRYTSQYAEISTWKEDEIKALGGVEFFNQEYDLRFINSANTVLPDNVLERIDRSTIPFIHKQYDIFENNIKWDYSDLKWIDDETIFDEKDRKKTYGMISVDVAEGLGLDYSIINIFKLRPKPLDLIEKQHMRYQLNSDFFQLEQIGIFRCNVVSIPELAELLYLIGFEFFDEDKFKIVLELNNHGYALAEAMKGVFDSNNNYSASIFMKYKHRTDSLDKRLGLKVNGNKSNILVKEYQVRMTSSDVIIHEETTASEINSFIKHETPNGKVTYRGDSGSNDDIAMTIVNLCSVFNELSYKEFCEDLLPNLINSNTEYKEIYQKVSGFDLNLATDYSSLYGAINMRKNI